jgi:hypothetical protein
MDCNVAQAVAFVFYGYPQLQIAGPIGGARRDGGGPNG